MTKIGNMPTYKHNIENLKTFCDEINLKIRSFFQSNL